jgi:hypothetical protein
MATGEAFRWLAANAELDRVLEQPPDARTAHLASLRARDPALAADVAALLEEQSALALLPSSVRNATTQTSDGSAALRMRPTGVALAPGMVLGPYRIVGLLGRGGMGTVYEADEIDSGRRIALKVLEERLHDPRERERFEREGRLAASLNHPHCVFVFAAAEVEGRPTIAMERMQGTLADRLRTQGPLPPADAVDATLQLIAGLQAAAAIGILHRDVKPSNCFVDADGVIKIGDFGISGSLWSAEAPALSTRTRFAATPAYASPEQLRGAALDGRADIYSLGATLYELLTGRPPFQRNDLMALLMAVANDPPQPPHALVSAVPSRLGQVVLRCLAKDPDQRFADYDALARALEPYSSSAPRPARLGYRFFAGAIDQGLLGLVGALVSLWGWVALIPFQRSTAWFQVQTWLLIMFACFALAEGVWATSPGKALFGLTLVDSKGRRPHPWRAGARAGLFSLFWGAGALLWMRLVPDADLRQSSGWIVVLDALLPLDYLGAWVLTMAAFSTVYFRHGHAGWHDLATGTQVVERANPPERRSAPQPEGVTKWSESSEKLGPFQVADKPIAAMPSGWLLGFDDRLRRPVWIRKVPPGTPALDAKRLTVSRPTRVRWLAGRRDADEAWDAFEAVAGVPLARAGTRPRHWAEVRWWLLDLARECVAQDPEDTALLRSERVWILDGGGAKLVDDPAADRDARPAWGPSGSCATLLLDVVRTTQGLSSHPLPLGAQRFVDSLRAGAEPGAASIVGYLETLARERAVVTRRWRALHAIGVVALPMFVSGFALFSSVKAEIWSSQLPREVHLAAYYLHGLQMADRGIRWASPEGIEAMEIVLATRYREILTSPGRLTGNDTMFMNYEADQLPRILQRRPSKADEERALQNQYVRSIEDSANIADSWGTRPMWRVELVAASFVIGLLAVAISAIVAALAFRGGWIRVLGLEIVTAAGRPASRRRVLARTLLVWGPLIVVVAPIIGQLQPIQPYWQWPALGEATTVGVGLALIVLFLGAVFAILHPERGIQDRLVNTWIVPR